MVGWPHFPGPCSTPLKRFDKFTDELFDNPLFPLLFISETTKLSALWAVGEASPEAVGVMAALSAPTTALWYFLGDDIEDAVDSTVEDVVDDDGT